MKNKLGENLASLRKKHGWSQKETAAKLGISQALLSHYEKGIRECGLEFLTTAAKVFSCSTDFLLGLSETKPIKENDTDSVSADLKFYPELEKSRNDTINTLNLLYSITARVGNPEICKDFNNVVLSELYVVSRLFEKRYFASENFKKERTLGVLTAQKVQANAKSSIINRMADQNINVNLSADRLKAEYPVCSKSFNRVVGVFEK